MLKIAWVSPLKANKNHSCYTDNNLSIAGHTTKLLLPLLRDKFNIKLFSHNFDSDLYPEALPVNNVFIEDKKEPFDLIFTQIDDSIAGKFTRLFSSIHPGLTWFHNVVFRNFAPESLSYSSWTEDNLALASSGHNIDVSKLCWRGEFKEYSTYGIRELSQSFHILCSDPWSMLEINQLRKGNKINNTFANTFGISKPYSGLLRIPIAENDIDNLKENTLRHDNQKLKIAFAGSSALETRYFKLFSALKSANVEYELVWGTVRSDIETAIKLCQKHSLSNFSVVELDSFKKWGEIVSDCHLSFHLILGVFDRLAPLVEISISKGTQPVVLNYSQGEFYPEKVVVKIISGVGETESIVNLLELYSKNLKNESRSETFSNFLRENHSLDECAKELGYIFTKLSRELVNPYAKWRELQNSIDLFIEES